MSTLLSLSITFLDDRFHGQGDDGPEWPPSPHRVYQAMLCAAARNGCDGEDEFRWFESIDPPEVLTPETVAAQRLEFFVPNNDADVSKKFERQNRLTSKVARPTRILGNSTTVRYLWSIQPKDQAMADKIAHHARLISAVGWGIDLAVADAQVVEDEDPAWFAGKRRWAPALHGRVLRCPAKGTLQDLREVYESFLNRIDGKFYQSPRRPGVFREVAYRPSGDTTPRRLYTAFKLIQPNDDTERFASFDPRRAMHVAAWVRGMACELSKSGKDSFVEGCDSDQYVAGHVPSESKNGPSPPRFSYLPIPSIGDPHADGRIRRFVVAEPYGSAGVCRRWARETLNLKTLTDNSGQEKAQLLYVQSDNMMTHYTKKSTVFETVTPVILSGHNDRSYKKTQKLLLKSINHAGFSLDGIEAIYLQKAPFFPGAFHPRDYALPHHIKEKPHSAIHARITWKQPIQGPLAIGAGRYFGLGLFAPKHGD